MVGQSTWRLTTGPRTAQLTLLLLHQRSIQRKAPSFCDGLSRPRVRAVRKSLRPADRQNSCVKLSTARGAFRADAEVLGRLTPLLDQAGYQSNAVRTIPSYLQGQRIRTFWTVSDACCAFPAQPQSHPCSCMHASRSRVRTGNRLGMGLVPLSLLLRHLSGLLHLCCRSERSTRWPNVTVRT